MNPVLLLVDLQEDYLADPSLIPAKVQLLARAAELLDGCRHRRIPIIHAWTTLTHAPDRRLPHWRQSGRWMCVAGTPGHAPPAELLPRPGEIIVHKTGFNAFSDSELAAVLGRLQSNLVILAGVHLHACVRTAAVECLERALPVEVAEDATGSNDPIHAAATRRWLAARCVQFRSTRAILAGFDGAPDRALAHRSPRITTDIMFEVPRCEPREVAAAVEAASEGWSSWRQTAHDFRQSFLEKAAEALLEAEPRLARQMALEIGKPLAHAHEEVRRAAANIRDVARRAGAFRWFKPESSGGVYRRPLGVIGLITPWNNPVAIPLGKIAPALAYGNAVVWKPAPAATAISQSILKLLLLSGLPQGPLQLIAGGSDSAQALAAHERLAAVTFTGSTQAGFDLQEICAGRLVPFQAELSGNNAAIVWDVPDLPGAAAQIVWGAFGFAGQRCTANRRVIVSRTQYERLLRELEAAAERLPWGDPLDRATEIGPVIDLLKRDQHRDLVERTRAEGTVGPVILTHRRQAQAPTLEAGSYAQPVIVGCDQPEHPLVQEETMSPLLVVQPARDFEHALDLCNGVRCGLAAALFSHSRPLQRQFIYQTHAGILKLNSCTAGVDPCLPFGGWKRSGLGPPEHGEADCLFYTRIQTVYGFDEVCDY